MRGPCSVQTLGRQSAFGACALALLPFIHGNVFSPISGSYPIRLVAADDTKVPSAASGVPTAIDGDLPSNLVAPQTLEPVLSKMWKQSRTFRRQCSRIGAEPRLLVRIYT